MSNKVNIVEVGARDGLQNEKQTIDKETKIEFINRLTRAGLSAIEAGSFVSAKWIPQMANSDEVMAKIERKSGISYPVLTPNIKGYENARDAEADTVAVFAAASEAFSQKNINCSIDESFDRFRPVLDAAKKDGIKVRGYISCVLGCPYEGKVSTQSVVHVAKRLYDMGCYEISCGDTIGVGTAGEVRQLVRAISSELPVSVLAGHFHDTYGQALANIYAGLEEGVSTFDCSVSGLGGCPYAPGATGNVATEDVVYMLHGSGLTTGIDLDLLIETSLWISERLDRQPSSRVTMAKRVSFQ